MAIITISRGSYFHAKTVAEKLAAKLGYTCLSRDEVIENLGPFHLSEIKLVGDLHDAFSVLDRFPNGKSRFITAMRCALLERFCQDNVVYHGLSGHHFLPGISHVLKVRITADLDDRVQKEAARTGMSAHDARYKLKRDDEERRKWCMYLYGVDIWNPNNYDAVLCIHQISVDEAVELLAMAARLPSFQAGAESRTALEDLALGARIQCALTDYPHAVVNAVEGQVTVTIKAPEEQKAQIGDTITSIVTDIPQVQALDLQIMPYY